MKIKLIYFLWILLIFLIILEIYQLIWGPEGVKEYLTLRNNRAIIVENIRKKEMENRMIREKIEKLRKDKNEREIMVRKRLNYIRDGEIYIHFLNDEDQK